MTVEVCVAWPDAVWRREIQVAEHTTLRDAVTASGLFDAYPELSNLPDGVGVYGKRREPNDIARDGDRIEVYRALSVDPKIARQRRVEKQRAARPDRWVRK
ncbi:MAG TPA: RnfH family protein [Burkholderiaceae bacterium]|nr:RnfH family protein [Burkholderiaceae bacterium]